MLQIFTFRVHSMYAKRKCITYYLLPHTAFFTLSLSSLASTERILAEAICFSDWNSKCYYLRILMSSAFSRKLTFSAATQNM